MQRPSTKDALPAEKEDEEEEETAGCEAAEVAVTPAPGGSRVPLGSAANQLNITTTTLDTTGKAQHVGRSVAAAEPEVDAGSKALEPTPQETFAQKKALQAAKAKVVSQADVDSFVELYVAQQVGPSR